jgi:hypothetical protein
MPTMKVGFQTLNTITTLMVQYTIKVSFKKNKTNFGFF